MLPTLSAVQSRTPVPRAARAGGRQGGWAPDRPFDYEPVPHMTANTIMAAGLLIGTAVGGVWPLGRTEHAGCAYAGVSDRCR